MSHLGACITLRDSPAILLLCVCVNTCALVMEEREMYYQDCSFSCKFVHTHTHTRVCKMQQVEEEEEEVK